MFKQFPGPPQCNQGDTRWGANQANNGNNIPNMNMFGGNAPPNQAYMNEMYSMWMQWMQQQYMQQPQQPQNNTFGMPSNTANMQNFHMNNPPMNTQGQFQHMNNFSDLQQSFDTHYERCRFEKMKDTN
tara:strand:+ start:377 stop:760 length:384 start_codon:yes stop_codon:yes gene_type:complete